MKMTGAAIIATALLSILFAATSDEVAVAAPRSQPPAAQPPAAQPPAAVPRPQLSVAQPPAAQPGTAVPTPARAKVVENSSAHRCENRLVRGVHTARAEWEARQGALEDVADVCPSGKINPTQMHCTPVTGAEGIPGYAATKCVQQALCILCGDTLSRQNGAD